MIGQPRKMPSRRQVQAYWAPILVALDKFDSIEEVMEEDYCFACGFYHRSEPRKRNTERCHIKSRARGGSDDVSNVHNLCRHCHLASEFLEDECYWKWFRKRTLRDALFHMGLNNGLSVGMLLGEEPIDQPRSLLSGEAGPSADGRRSS